MVSGRKGTDMVVVDRLEMGIMLRPWCLWVFLYESPALPSRRDDVSDDKQRLTICTFAELSPSKKREGTIRDYIRDSAA
jgi:hypothetical protein